MRKGFVGIVAGAAIALASCSSSSKVLNAGKVEKAIAQGIKEQTGVTVKVNCPSDVKFKKGKVITCKATQAEGQPANVDVTMEDDKGKIAWKLVR